MRANSEPLTAPQALADNFYFFPHNNPQKSTCKSSFRHDLFAPHFGQKLPAEAETST
jgi:hypothetical protein